MPLILFSTNIQYIPIKVLTARILLKRICLRLQWFLLQPVFQATKLLVRLNKNVSTNHGIYVQG